MKRTQEQIAQQVKLMEAQKMVIDSAIAVLQRKAAFEDFDGEDYGSLGAEHAAEWLEQESEYDVFDVPVMRP